MKKDSKRVFLRPFLSILVLAALTACAGNSSATGSLACPRAGIIPEASTLPVFEKDAAPRHDTVRVMGTIPNFRGACKLGKNGELRFHLEVDFDVRKTDLAGDLRGMKLPYFVAVLSPDQQIIQRQSDWLKVEFNKRGVFTGVESKDIVIPLENPAAAGAYQIAIGYALTPEQAAYNRGELKEGR